MVDYVTCDRWGNGIMRLAGSFLSLSVVILLCSASNLSATETQKYSPPEGKTSKELILDVLYEIHEEEKRLAYEFSKISKPELFYEINIATGPLEFIDVFKGFYLTYKNVDSSGCPQEFKDALKQCEIAYRSSYQAVRDRYSYEGKKGAYKEMYIKLFTLQWHKFDDVGADSEINRIQEEVEDAHISLETVLSRYDLSELDGASDPKNLRLKSALKIVQVEGNFWRSGFLKIENKLSHALTLHVSIGEYYGNEQAVVQLGPNKVEKYSIPDHFKKGDIVYIDAINLRSYQLFEYTLD